MNEREPFGQIVYENGYHYAKIIHYRVYGENWFRVQKRIHGRDIYTGGCVCRTLVEAFAKLLEMGRAYDNEDRKR